MAYIKQTWIDSESVANADRLKHIEDGIYTNSSDIEKLASEVKATSYDLVPDSAPVRTGRKINGKDECVLELNFGSLPNNTYKDLPIGLEKGTFKLHDIRGYAIKTDDGEATGDFFPLSYATSLEGSMIALLYVSSTNSIRIQTWTDRTNCDAYVTIYFTYVE